ncbi:hypothetical protein K438DRAFT_1976971 [Mycena galopus ATCC 62051]|nr:hypothetical protein K438DRAFT_1976971 [Mycena galopus ATCC 62051]
MHISTAILQFAVLCWAVAVHGLAVPGDPTLQQRTVNPACLKSVEPSCLNLAVNCLNSVNSGNINNLFEIASCVAAATCYGVGDLITSVECQTGLR